MSQTKAEFIKIAVPEGSKQTNPVEPENRLPDSDIRIEFCDESDADKIVSTSILTKQSKSDRLPV
jgi:hypothetical protein